MPSTPTEAMAAYERATRAHDLPALLALIDDDAVYFFSNESDHVGKPAIEAAIRRNFEVIQDETYVLEDRTWLVTAEDVAACVYNYRWTGTVHGEPASGGGRGTTVLRRTDEGWKVVHEHLSRGRYVP